MLGCIIIGFFVIYMLLIAVVIFTAPEGEIEMYKGKPRYKHTADGWYGEVELWNRKKKKFIYV
jgi:hypothetical protein